MRNTLLGLLVAGIIPVAHAQNIAVNETGAAADPQALLDISSTTKGLLIPRLSLTQRDAIGVGAGDEGLVIFQTNGNPNGFHVYHAGNWVPLITGKNGWDLFGNRLSNGTMPNPDFIGTTDARPMLFRTDNTYRMKLAATTGFLDIGNAIGYVAKERLDIHGALEMYYEAPNAHKYYSENNAAGTIRYVAFQGVRTGGTAPSPPYEYGNGEKPATSPDNATTRLAIYGSPQPYPLEYAGHWGNINGLPVDSGYTVGTAPPTYHQPSLGGWRALENPYTEVFQQSWTHFAEAECATGLTASAVIPTGVPQAMSNTLSASEGSFVSPLPRYNHTNPFTYTRHQYLFFKEELDLELAQANLGLNATEGICPGIAIDSIGMEFNTAANYEVRPAAPYAHVIVRNAPPGLDHLDEFDNSPMNTGDGCGAIPNNWLNPIDGGISWRMVRLNPPFIWDGNSNVIVEVSGIMQRVLTAAPGVSTPVRMTEQDTNVTYAVNVWGGLVGATDTWLLPVPPADQEWYCPAASANYPLRLPSAPSPSSPLVADYGASKWRPKVKFVGSASRKSTTNPGPGTTSGTGRYITYPGALILEDTAKAGKLNSMSPGFPWSRWRMGFPDGSAGFTYRSNGTISAQNGVYDNRLRLNDHVFDRAFDGRVAPKDAALHGQDQLLGIDAMANFTRTNRHLPTMQGRSDWERSKGFSLGDLTNQLWTTAEAHALYVADLHDKLDLIEVLASDRPLNTKEYRTAARQLAAMPEYTDAEKARLINDLRRRTPTLRTTP